VSCCISTDEASVHAVCVCVCVHGTQHDDVTDTQSVHVLAFLHDVDIKVNAHEYRIILEEIQKFKILNFVQHA